MNPESVEGLSAESWLMWSMFFSNIVAMHLHPGFRVEPDLQRCAYLADRMLLEALKRR